jgi:hypothetical protein
LKAQGQNSDAGLICDSVKATVVVGFAEAMSAPEATWSLIDAGFQVVAFARKGRVSALRHSRHVQVREIVAPETDAGAAQKELETLLLNLQDEKPGAPLVLFPLDDSALWLASRASVPDGVLVAGPQGPSAAIALDKRLQAKVALAAGFQVLPFCAATTAAEVLKETRRLPLILKPADAVLLVNGRLRKGRGWICANEEELQKAVQLWAEKFPLLVQSYVPGTGEGVFGLATEEGVKAWSGHRRLRMMNPHGSGSSACISQGVSTELKACSQEFIRQAQWRGQFMIELLRDLSGQVWFLEFNGRPWGSTALSRRQGFEYPAWNVELTLNPKSRREFNIPPKADIVCRNAGRELMYPLFVLRGPKSKALTHWPSFWRALGDVVRFRRDDVFYNWRADDRNVFFRDCFYTVRDQFFKSRN